MRADAELVERAAAGDRDAFAALYDRYATPVHDLLRRMLRDDHEASDALQDTFITAGERLHQLRDPSRFRPWVYAIARRRAYLVTSRQRRFETLEDDDVISAEPDYSEGLAAAELCALIEGAAGGLDDKDRLLLDLQVRHGLEGQDLADAVGVDRGHVHVMAHRLRERLERSLGALVLVRHGQAACAALSSVVGADAADGQLTPALRKRVSRHADDCATCTDERDRRLRREALLGLVPFAPAPAGAREAVLERVQLCSHSGAPWDGPDGFPPGAARPGRRRHRRRSLVALVLALLVVAVAAWVSVLAQPLRPVVAVGDPDTTVPSAPSASDVDLTTTSAGGPTDPLMTTPASDGSSPSPSTAGTEPPGDRPRPADTTVTLPGAGPTTPSPTTTAAPRPTTTTTTRPPRTTTTTSTTQPPVVTIPPRVTTTTVAPPTRVTNTTRPRKVP